MGARMTARDSSSSASSRAWARIFGVATACFVLVDAHQPAVVQTRQTLVIPASGFFGRAGPGGGNLLLLILEIGEGLLGSDPIALFNGETAYNSTGASDDRCLPVGAKGCRGRVEGGNRLTNNLAGAHRDRRFFLFTVSVLAVPARPVAAGLAAAATGSEYRHE